MCDKTDKVPEKTNALCPDQQENLRTEYEVCQQAANNETSGIWSFAGIFLAFSSVILAAIIAAIFQKSWLLLLGFIDIFLSVGFWIIYYKIWEILKRANDTQKLIFMRMQCIENDLGNIHLRKMLAAEGIGTRGTGENWFKCILTVLSVLWLVVLIVIWVLVIARFY